MASKRHTHKYYQVEMNGGMSWACALGDCSHFLPENVKNTISGKLSICWSCEREFNLDERALKLEMPICINCALGNSEAIDKMLEPNLFRSLEIKCDDCGSGFKQVTSEKFCEHCIVFHLETKS